jgi:deoxyguanosine kinase
MFSIVSGKYIAVEGVIGVGKTTLVRNLSLKYSIPTVLEVVEENPFLPSFYKTWTDGPSRHSSFFLF